MSTISVFKGLNTVTDPLRLGLAWLTQADNIDITETGAIKKRSGYVKTLPGAITSAYSTLDFSRCFVVDGGTLKAMTGPAAAVSLLAVGDAPMHFTEVNGQVFFNNGTDSGIINPDGEVMDWAWPVPASTALSAVTGNLPAGLYRACCTFTLADGRETGAGEPAELVLTEGHALQITGIPQFAGVRTNLYIAPADSTVFQRAFSPAPLAAVWNESPDALGADLLTDGLDPLPEGVGIVQHWQGRIYAAQYMAQADQTVLWFSQPLGFHLFDVAKDFILIPGRVTMLAPHDGALIVGTDMHVHAYDGAKLVQLAAYGVAPGQHWAMDEAGGRRILFWSSRGLCAALPFVNLTERQVSVAPGTHAAGALVQQDGRNRYLVSLKSGGTAFNPLT